jgi:D-beta-D-heptose 7-phosphate kinase/D-beta-D-heptose 1-phosphate adenosyltransferase
MPFDLHQDAVKHMIAMQNTKVLVLGDVLLDAYIFGKVSRISPEAPVPVLHQSKHRHVAGGAANVAANTANFGAATWICGRVGTDKDGETLERICRENGIDTSYLLHSDSVPTITKTRVLAGYQQIVRIDSEEITELPSDDQKRVLKYIDEFLAKPGAKVVIISDYAKGFLPYPLITAAIAACNRAKVPVVTDPKSSDVARYKGSTAIKPNLKDGHELLRTASPGYRFDHFETDVLAMSKIFLERSGAEHVVLSLAEKGVHIRSLHGGKTHHLPSQALQVADVSGAGDTMVAFLAMGMGAGLSIVDAANVANICSGIACGKPGTATVSAAEFLDAVRNLSYGGTGGRVLSLLQAVSVVEQQRELNRRIVFTNGCFDILHAGHVMLLQKARSLGDILVVGLNSDKSITRLKGPSRPIQNESDRGAILAALQCVDFVVVFEEDTPLKLIEALKPEILVKGGDYNPDTVVGAREVASWNGRVEIIPLLEGRSTTNIVAKSETK